MTIGLMSTPFTVKTISGIFGSTFGSGDKHPTLGSKTDQPLSTLTISRRSYPYVTGVIAITAGSGHYRINGGAWVNTNGVLVPTDYIEARVNSSGSYATEVTLTFSLDAGSDIFSVTTLSDVVYLLDPDGNQMLDPDGNPIQEF